MRIIRAKDYEEMSRRGANLIAAQVRIKPNCVLGLATGSTPIGLYQHLIQWYQNGDLDFSQVQSVNLDEYWGLSPEHDQSYRYFMNDNLFQHVNIPLAHTNVPNGLAEDAAQECQRYEAVIQGLGGIDLQLLGLGHNGHIAFNEPADSFSPMTHHVALTESTIQANQRFFASIDDVPKSALSMGIGSIMKAKRILLLVSGAEKADILKRSLTGAITPQVPASVLQLHRDVTVVADEAALAQLR